MRRMKKRDNRVDALDTSYDVPAGARPIVQRRASYGPHAGTRADRKNTIPKEGSYRKRRALRVPRCVRCKAELKSSELQWCPECAAKALHIIREKNHRIIMRGVCTKSGCNGTYRPAGIDGQFRCTECGEELFIK